MSRNELLGHLGLPLTFPEFFPPQLEQYRRSIAEGADAPDEYAVAYMLAAASTAAGAEVSACVQPGWYVRCNMFLAVVGHKGSGKSTLADKCFGPLVRHEEELRDAIARPTVECGVDVYDDDEEGPAYGCGYCDDEEEGDEEEDDDGEGVSCYTTTSRRRAAEQPDPCVVVNDCTGPALLQLLEHNRRQLLVNTDELSGHLARSNGGSDRAMWCELYDGRRRRRERATTKAGSATLDAPYVSLIGSVQPELLKAFYNSRGDDGLLDRVLLVGDGVMREAGWPRDADDPVLNAAWSTAMTRLLRIEEHAADEIGQHLESRFTPDALEVCRGLLTRLNELATIVGVPHSQRGVVKKLVQHAVKLALLHRCLRWAAGEFGETGPLGEVEAQDAIAARDATLFFLGRWLIWRKELCGGGMVALAGPVGLSRAAGDDPVLQSLAAVATGAQRTVSVIERLVRLLRVRGSQPVMPATLTALQTMSDVALGELRGACDWLVDNGHASWLDPECREIRLVQAASPGERGQREPISAVKERAK
jgi:energy-coupling factor transporter ATP-binding protein EcfA2